VSEPLQSLPLPLGARAPAKVNLCLRLGPVLPDGRHRIVTLLESLSLADELTLTALPPPGGFVARGRSNGDEVVCEGVAGENLAAAALRCFRRASGWDGPPVHLRIDKRVPVAGGMGGGSGDAAAALRLVVAASGLGAQQGSWLLELAAELGSDVPSQLAPGLVLGLGAGERVQPLPALPAHAVLVLPAGVGLSTAAVYAEADRLGLGRTSAELEAVERELAAAVGEGGAAGTDGAGQLPLDLFGNDLEPAARSLHPPIGDALQAARDQGAALALVSGSGPTVAGVFPGEHGAARARAAAAALAARYPGATAAVPVGADFGAVRAVELEDT